MVSLTIESFALALTQPLTTAAGTIEHREGFLVRVERDGSVGVGTATPLPGWTESRSACRAALERAALASRDTAPEMLLDSLPDGCTAARHGLALALSDMAARTAGQPLYRYLGGTERVTSVPVNATIGDTTIEETVTAALNAVDKGYTCLKCKVGARSVKTDIQRLHAVRDAVGPAVELRADANGAWNRGQATRAFNAFDTNGVRYVEQPLSPDDLAGHADLRRMDVDVGVALDETLSDTAITTVLEAGAADVLILKPMVVGGVDRVREIAQLARTDATAEADSATDVVITTTIDGAYARAGAVHAAASIPMTAACGLATGDRIAEDLVPAPPSVTEGQIAVPQGNGNIACPTDTTDA